MSEQNLIETSVGWALHGDNLYRGWSVSNDLFGKTTLWSALSLGVGHRRLSEEESHFLDDLAIAIVAADPRVWPLKITWLVGSYGSSFAAMAAAHQFLASASMGPAVCREVGELWRDLAAILEVGEFEERAARFFDDRRAAGRLPPGFGSVPGRARDERLDLIDRAVHRHSRQDLPFYAMARRIEPVLESRLGATLNLTAMLAACLLDIGFSVEQLSSVAAFSMCHTLWASAQESASLRPRRLQRIDDDDIDYLGREPRRLARP